MRVHVEGNSWKCFVRKISPLSQEKKSRRLLKLMFFLSLSFFRAERKMLVEQFKWTRNPIFSLRVEKSRVKRWNMCSLLHQKKTNTSWPAFFGLNQHILSIEKEWETNRIANCIYCCFQRWRRLATLIQFFISNFSQRRKLYFRHFPIRFLLDIMSFNYTSSSWLNANFE